MKKETAEAEGSKGWLTRLWEHRSSFVTALPILVSGYVWWDQRSLASRTLALEVDNQKITAREAEWNVAMRKPAIAITANSLRYAVGGGLVEYAGNEIQFVNTCSQPIVDLTAEWTGERISFFESAEDQPELREFSAVAPATLLVDERTKILSLPSWLADESKCGWTKTYLNLKGTGKDGQTLSETFSIDRNVSGEEVEITIYREERPYDFRHGPVIKI